MVDIVRSNSSKNGGVADAAAARGLFQIIAFKSPNCFHKPFMIDLEHSNIPLPLPGPGAGGAVEPVASFQVKRSFFLPKNAPPHDVLPIRTMNDNFPNSMPAPVWSPRSLFYIQSADRAAKIRAVPCFGTIRLRQEVNEDFHFGGWFGHLFRPLAVRKAGQAEIPGGTQTSKCTTPGSKASSHRASSG